MDIPLGGDVSPAYKDEDGAVVWTPDYRGNLAKLFDDPQPINDTENMTGTAVPIAGEQVGLNETPSAAGKARLNGYLGAFVGNSRYELVIMDAYSENELIESLTIGDVSVIPDGSSQSMVKSGKSEEMSADSSGQTGYAEFDVGMGINLPSADFGLTDVFTIIMDGSQVGFSIGIPLGGYEKNMTNQNSQGTPTSGPGSQTPPPSNPGESGSNPGSSGATGAGQWTKPGNAVGDAMEQLVNFVNREQYRNQFKSAKEQMNNGKGINSKNFSANFSLSLAFIFEYNPIDASYYFSTAALSASANLEFTMQYRFTPCPILYVYLKTGFSAEISTGISVARVAVTGNSVTPIGGGSVINRQLQAGESVSFRLDMHSEVEGNKPRGFHLDMTGEVYMEVKDSEGKLLTSGKLASTGKDITEVVLKEYDKLVTVTLKALKKSTLRSIVTLLRAESVTYWNGLTISPKGFIEIGAGVGIEVLHAEIYLKGTVGLELALFNYIVDEDRYEGFNMNSFDLSITLGFNITAFFFNYSMDIIGFYLHGEQEPGTLDTSWEYHGGLLSDAINIGGDTVGGKSRRSRSSLVSASAPIDINGSQQLISAEETLTRAINANDADVPFQLSGYGTSGDAFKLAGGMVTGYSYKAFTVGDETYILYPLSVSTGDSTLDHTRLVMSKVAAYGEASGLKNPVDADSPIPYIPVDNETESENTGDLDFAVDVSDSVVTVAWTSYAAQNSADTDFAAASKNVVVKRASIDLAGETEFGCHEIVSGNEAFARFMPVQAGNVTVYAETTGYSGVEAANERLRSYLSAVYGLEDADLESGTNDPQKAPALYRWTYQKDLNELYGDGSRLVARVRSKARDAAIDIELPTAANEFVENIDAAELEGTTYVAYSTAQNVYFDEYGKTTLTPNENSDLAAVKRLYLTSFDGEARSETKLLRTAVDFDKCTATNIAGCALRDGLYSGGHMTEQAADPYFSGVKFLKAKLSADDELQTILLFEMAGNTYLIEEADLTGTLGNATKLFSETTGTNAVLGVSESGSLAVVYTAPVGGTTNTAIYAAWWDNVSGTWGSPNILAMNHLQVYEDGLYRGLTDVELEKAYLGKATGNAAYDSYIAGLDEVALLQAKGGMDHVSFANLQMTAAGEQLLVFTEGSFSKLQDVKFDAGGKEIRSVAASGTPELGFYVIAFGAGIRKLEQEHLRLDRYDFSAGSYLSGTLYMTNAGTAGIRASAANPAAVTLTAVNDEEGLNEIIAKWSLVSNVTAGARFELPFTMTVPLSVDLPAGTVFRANIQEHTYFEENAYSASTADLLTVEIKPELRLDTLTAKLNTVEGNTAVVELLDMTLSNRGSETVEDVFVQFSCEAADGNYDPIDLTGSSITVGAQEPIPQGRGITGNDLSNGVIAIRGSDGSALEPGYQRSVTGTLCVPLTCFRNDSTSGLRLRAEVFSGADSYTMQKNLYISSHDGEYDGVNNTMTSAIAHITGFDAPANITVALGNTRQLPIGFVSSSSENDISVRELPDGTESWTPKMGILSYDSERNIIVAAPSVEGNGVIQLEDRSTNSIRHIAFSNKKQGTGVNIFKNDETFTFADQDTDWDFIENALTWSGETETAPMDNDYVRARVNGASVSFPSKADSITLYFSGSVTVSSDINSFQSITATASPITVDFGNATGATHNIVIMTNSAGTLLDRFTETFAENVDPIPEVDAGKPQILWNRSFPETASMSNGSSAELVCYVTDDIGLAQIKLDPADPASITKHSDTLWSFPVTVSANGVYLVTAIDNRGNETASRVNVDWFNTTVSSGAIAAAPDFDGDDLRVETASGAAIGTGLLSEPPYLKSSYIPGPNETVAAFSSVDGSFTAEGGGLTPGADGRWPMTSNAFYLVRVTDENGKWSQAVIEMKQLDLSIPSLTAVQSGNGLRIEAQSGSDAVAITGLTVNGYSILPSGSPNSCRVDFRIAYSGSYTVEMSTATGKLLTLSVEAELPLIYGGVVPASTAETTPTSKDGSLTLSLSEVFGGSYDSGASTPAANSYAAKYETALIPLTDKNAQYGFTDAVWTAKKERYTDLPHGWYRIAIRSASSDTPIVTEPVFVSCSCFITLPAEQIGYTLAIADNSTSPVEHGGSCSFTLRLAEGYTQSVPTIRVNGLPAELENGGFTVSDITMDLLITVEGVEKNTYTVSFNSNGIGSATASQTVIHGENAAVPTEPDANGWIFNGWYKDEACTEEFDFGSAIYGELELYANWTGDFSSGFLHNYCTLAFNTNGGSAIASVIKLTGTTVSLSSFCPTRAGHEFTGWYSDAALTNMVTSLRLTGNATVYAGWEKEAVAPVSPFIDVFESDWFYSDVLFAYDNGLMNGTGDSTFSPNMTTTRGMIVTVLYRLEGKPAVSGACPFDDVKPGSYYEDAVKWAAANGIVNGYGDSKFGPDDDITREQMAAILYRFAEYRGYDISGRNSLALFNDADRVSTYALNNVKWAVAAGLMSGMGDGTIAPRGSATRAQIAAILHRFINRFVK